MSAPLRIAVSGASGLIGSALCDHLANDFILRLVRHKPEFPGEVFWQPGPGPRGGQIEEKALEGLDAAVHLAGAPIFDKRWTADRKALILASRVESTRLLARTLAGLEKPPRVLVCASGIHFYGDRGDQELTEDASVGSGFLAEVCRDWEAAADPARQAGIRVVHLRIGMVLSRRAGALKAMLPVFRLGLGCVVGKGTQYWSWIALEDVIGAIMHTITSDLRGPVNVVSPTALRAQAFAATLAKACDRQLFARVPPWTIRAALGERAEVLMWSTRGVPEKLRKSGYKFVQGSLESALRAELARP